MNKKRAKYGKRAALVGILGNSILTILNMAIGIMSGSYALFSEGAHTLSDILTTIIAYIGFRIGQKPADAEHPIGHGRAEALAGLIITIFLIVVGLEIIKGAIERLLNPGLITTPTYLAAVMAIIGIITNIIISTYIIRLGKKINSPAIIADGQHQRVDVFSSVAIVFGVILSRIGYPIFDPIIGIVISLLIFKTARDVCRINVDAIMGKVGSPEIIKDIEKVANSVPEVYGTRKIIVNNFGTYAVVFLYIELEGDLKLKECHNIVQNVQNAIIEEVDVVIKANISPYPHDYNKKEINIKKNSLE